MIRGSGKGVVAFSTAFVAALLTANVATAAPIGKSAYIERADRVCSKLDGFDIQPFLRAKDALRAGKQGRAARLYRKSQRAELHEVGVLRRIPKPPKDADLLSRAYGIQADSAHARLAFAALLRKGRVSQRLDRKASRASARAATILTGYGISCFGTLAP